MMWATFFEISSLFWIFGVIYVIGQVAKLIETKAVVVESELPQNA